MKKLRTHYDNLKVPRDASSEVIRAAYKKLAVKHHPDKNKGSAESLHRMQIINAAYAVLSNDLKRAAHDSWIKSRTSSPRKASASTPTSQPAPSNPRPPSTPPRPRPPTPPHRPPPPRPQPTPQPRTTPKAASPRHPQPEPRPEAEQSKKARSGLGIALLLGIVPVVLFLVVISNQPHATPIVEAPVYVKPTSTVVITPYILPPTPKPAPIESVKPTPPITPEPPKAIIEISPIPPPIFTPPPPPAPAPLKKKRMFFWINPGTQSVEAIPETQIQTWANQGMKMSSLQLMEAAAPGIWKNADEFGF